MRGFFNIFKSGLIALLGLLFILTILLLVAGVYIFIKPEVVVNKKNIKFALNKSKILKSYSWTKLDIKHEFLAWNKRELKGDIENLCFHYENVEIDTSACLEKLSWDFELSWNFSSGLTAFDQAPIFLRSSYFKFNNKKESEDKTPSNIDYYTYWKLLWNEALPELDLKIEKISIGKTYLKKPPFELAVEVKKTDERLNASAYNLKIEATRNGFTIYSPKKFKIPYELKKNKELYIDQVKLNGKISKNNILLDLIAKMDTVLLNVESFVPVKYLKEDFTRPEIQTDILKNTKGKIVIGKLSEALKDLIPEPYNVLPAPLNAMEGSLIVNLNVLDYLNKTSAAINTEAFLDLASSNQALRLTLNSKVPLSLTDYSVGALDLNLNFREVRLLMPELSRTRLPPKILPDGRFKRSEKIVVENKNLPEKVIKKTTEKKPLVYDLNIKALNKNIITINTNLLDEPLRLNLDLFLGNGSLQHGFILAHHFKTTLFKRKIELKAMRINFETPLEPHLEGDVEFDLPDYLVSMHLEGPVSAPRMALKSSPPLPESDIYAVLLFGKPMSDLSNEDSTAAQNTSRLVSQGVLSLAVLYYFSGTPIESIGYDPNSNEINAQIGLGRKNSLRVGGNGSGLNSAGIRRSLGKGWYIDSEIQKTIKDNSSINDFGVLLERIIAY